MDADARPDGFGEINVRGVALFNEGRYDEAVDTYRDAVERFPELDIAYANLACALQERGDLIEARRQYERALHLNPRNSVTHGGYSFLCSLLGDERTSLRHFQTAVALKPVRIERCTAETPKCRALILASCIATNVNTNHTGLFDNTLCETTLVFLEFWDPQQPLPQHDVVLNAISDADTAGSALDMCEAYLARLSDDALNPPRAIRGTGRKDVAARLRDIPGARVPLMALIGREALRSRGVRALNEHGFHFPVLLRARGFHNGRHFELVESEETLAAAVATLPNNDDLLVIEFVDTRGADGAFYKYRAMMIGGRVYPLHLAIADEWKVHYAHARMEENAGRRAIETQYLHDHRAHLGAAADALQRIADAMGLDYGGIDFGIDARGRVVVFEANATMAVFDPPPGEAYAYRRPAVQAARDAFMSMVWERSSRTP